MTAGKKRENPGKPDESAVVKIEKQAYQLAAKG
jgi:hypothetical protein